ncbi:MAG: enoyl-CoA hydratase/isomerase family protein [Alphaproteobacteria bacterium]|nr:enoyl-CoA hydratase/isomerase family protein [Alphaproteobacteria bacterium]
MAKITVEQENGVARVTFANPERRNAMDDGFFAELTSIMTTLGRDEGVRTIVLAAQGPIFCAGGDLNWMAKGAKYDRAENIADMRSLGDMLRTINETPRPVIARVQGPAYGGGVGLLCVCDVVLAVAHAKFSLSETRLGLIPGVISPFVIAALGPRQSRRYALTGELFGAQAALDIGLVHEIVAEDALDGRIAEIADNIRKGGPQAVAGSKALMRRVAWRPVDDALMSETAELIADVRAGAEAAEGIAAFLEKRRPNWLDPDGSGSDER